MPALEINNLDNATTIVATNELLLDQAGVSKALAISVLKAFLDTNTTNIDNITIEFSGGKIAVKENGITTRELAIDSVETENIKDSQVTDDKIATGINATKLANGSVSNTELQYINSLTSNVQTQINDIVLGNYYVIVHTLAEMRTMISNSTIKSGQKYEISDSSLGALIVVGLTSNNLEQIAILKSRLTKSKLLNYLPT